MAQTCRTDSSQIADLLSMPPNYEPLGEVEVDCNSHERSDGLFFLSTFGSCNTRYLIGALKDRASEVGGDALVARRCDSDSDESLGFDDKPVRSESISCKAVVARRIDPKSPSSGTVVTAIRLLPEPRPSSTATKPPAVSDVRSITPTTVSPSKASSGNPKKRVRSGSCSKLPCSL
jgi:hypothetical protein